MVWIINKSSVGIVELRKLIINLLFRKSRDPVPSLQLSSLALGRNLWSYTNFHQSQNQRAHRPVIVVVVKAGGVVWGGEGEWGLDPR